MSGTAMRVYLPSTVCALRTFRDRGSLSPPQKAHAVTPGLREWYIEGDEEELEYVAFTRAAQSALRLISQDPNSPRRRAVISIDVSSADVRWTPGELGSSCVEVVSLIALSAVVSIHVDGMGAVKDVEAAVEVVTQALAGDDDAQFIVDSVEDHELEWFDLSEWDHVVSELLIASPEEPSA